MLRNLAWLLALFTLLEAAAQPREPLEQPSAHRFERGDDGWAEKTVKNLSLEEKVGQLFTTYVYGSEASTPSSENQRLYGVSTPAEVVAKYHLGGVIYFAWTDSLRNPQQIATLRDALQKQIAALDEAAKAAGPKTAADIDARVEQLNAELADLKARRKTLK